MGKSYQQFFDFTNFCWLNSCNSTFLKLKELLLGFSHPKLPTFGVFLLAFFWFLAPLWNFGNFWPFFVPGAINIPFQGIKTRLNVKYAHPCIFGEPGVKYPFQNISFFGYPKTSFSGDVALASK